MAELRTAVEIAGWLSAGLLLQRVAAGEADPLVTQAVLACASELAEVPPPGLIADVAALLAGARLPLAGAPVAVTAAGGAALRTAIHAYDDDLLARLVTGARWDDVVAAFAHAREADRPAAVALVVGGIARRSGFSGTQVNPAALRRALARPRDEREAAGRAGLADAPTVAALAAAYQLLARGARQTRALVEDREVFAVDHLAVLRDLGGRMTADHIQSAAEAIARTLPRRLPAKRAARGLRDTHMTDESVYPAGGFASITAGGATTGNIENLVTSELVYMDDDEPIDVFSLRYIEGELLHYTRDDSVFRRHRHLIGIALAPDLDDARVKDRELPWQRLVLAFGLVVAAARWLAAQLGDQALVIRIAFPPGLLVEERGILALLLEGEIARGTVVVVEEALADTLAATTAAAGSAIADLVVLALGAAPEVPRPVRALLVDLAAAAPAVSELSPRRGAALDPGRDAWAGWCDSAEDLLRWLV